jgi:hypothetical protein
VLQTQLVAVAKAAGCKVYLATISVIGEETDAKNHPELARYAAAAQAVGKAEGVHVVDLLSQNLDYEADNNCLNLHGGLLTGAGVHPYTPQGQRLLANAHAEGIIAALSGSAEQRSAM